MKQLLFSFLVLLSAPLLQAQTLSTTLLTTPCNNNGVIQVTASGLTPPITYEYYYGNFTLPPTIHTGAGTLDTLTAWPGGDVTIYANSGGSSYASTSYHSTAPFTYLFTSAANVCPTPSTLSVAVTGGTGSFTYHWYSASGALLGTTNPLSTTASGQMYLIANDGAGCSFDSRYSRDTGCNINFVSPFTLTTSSTVANCTNGTASVTGLSGGTPPYYYLWSNGATTPTATGLMGGLYAVNIVDAAGCHDDSNYVFITQTPTIDVYTTIAQPTCLDTDGSVTAYGSGGATPYSYVWSNGATTPTLTGLGASSLYVTATDANGCVGVGSAYLSPTTPIIVTYSTTPSACTTPNGTATLTLSGGTTPYAVQWFTTPGQTGLTASGLMAGWYNFKVVDAAGCEATGTVYIPPVAVIAAGASITAARCTSATGGISLSPSGGATPYTYSWSTGSSASAITSLASGIYTFTVTDHNGCKTSGTKYVPVFSPLHVSFATTPASCLFTPDGRITASASGGTATYNYNWNTGATTATITGQGAGLYWVSVTDAAGCTAWDTVTLGYNAAADFCYCTIEGNVYFDRNGNCTRDAGEPGIQNIQMHCSGMGYAYTDTAGYYAFKVPTGTYTVSQQLRGYNPLSGCQSNSISATVTAASGCTHVINFADTVDPIHDMHISTWDYTSAVPGNTHMQTTIITNEGTQSEAGILAGYKTDGQLYTPTFSPTGIFAAGGTNWYNTAGTFPTLNPAQSTQMFMNYNVPTNIPLGTTVVTKDTVAYTSPISLWTTDYSPWNNVSYLNTVIVGSYDPNFKEVSPKGYGANGTISYKDSVLEYMVHFQNTGTWYAQKVVVIDTLDAALDWTSLHPVFQSHKCKVAVTEHGVATFTFDNINLDPQSFNDARSNGMFTYTIKTKPNLNIGTRIKNTAAIYFDYNKPVYTNTTLNTIGWPQSLPTVNEAPATTAFTLYPNPADNTFNVLTNNETEGTYNLRVTDITGKTMINRSLHLEKGNQTINVDAATLSSGIYFVTLTNNGQGHTQKLVIIK